MNKDAHRAGALRAWRRTDGAYASVYVRLAQRNRKERWSDDGNEPREPIAAIGQRSGLRRNSGRN